MVTMRFSDYLRDEVRRLRDSYDRKPADMKRLYAQIKLRQNWKRPVYRHYLGGGTMDWLLGLEKYGDAHGWYEEALRLVAREVGR